MQYVLMAGVLYGLWSFAADALMLVGVLAGVGVALVLLGAALRPKGRH